MNIFNTYQSDLLVHNGKKCRVIGELPETQYDKEDVGLMYNIELEDGTKLQAFEDELTEEKGEVKMEKQIWRIPVTWEVYGEVEIEADSLEEALAIVVKDEEDMGLPTESFYVDGSFRATSEDLDEVRDMIQE